jgi:glutamate N-acetyltransferase/amino-acid N-acetyltransferase
MAVGLSQLPTLYPVKGIRLATGSAGIKYKDRPDLVVIEIAPGAQAAGVFTRNRFCAAPVIVARKHIAEMPPRALLINAGNANAGTGDLGIGDALACCDALAEQLGCSGQEVAPFSTGVIGERLPREAIIDALPACVGQLAESSWADAAHGIMTTDTLAKGVSREFEVEGSSLTITGIVKGAGMICPNMGTMLAFIATDASVTRDVLQECINQTVTHSFNRITIDGDTSTNDSFVLVATGQGQAPLIDNADSVEFMQLAQVVSQVTSELAQAIVRDAEGATNFITIDVSGGVSEAECLEVAYTIAHSPLVKTAFFASDPNWGRILAAIGRAKIPALDVRSVSIYLDEVRIVNQGAVDPEYSESRGQAVMDQPEIDLKVDVGMGSATARIWTSDLSHDYVQINAEYRS